MELKICKDCEITWSAEKRGEECPLCVIKQQMCDNLEALSNAFLQAYNYSPRMTIGVHEIGKILLNIGYDVYDEEQFPNYVALLKQTGCLGE